MGTMNLWILKFLPYEGSLCHALFFKTAEAAKKIRSEALESKGVILLKDDFNIEMAIDPAKCVIMLTNCESGAGFMAALNTANAYAGKAYGLPASMVGQSLN